MDEILYLLRGLIQDLDGSIYSDESLNRLIITSAIIVQNEVEFSQDYTVSIINQTITPDPTDNSFILFTAFKSAILLIQTEIRKSSSQSIKIVDGPSSIDLTGTSKNYSDLLKSLNDQYQKMRIDYSLSNNGSGSFGYCVTTPTTVYYYSPNEFH